MNNLYMVLVACSRTRQKRSYRIFQIISSYQNGEQHAIEDCTAHVCKLAGVSWNNKLGTFDSTEAYRHDDCKALQDKIHNQRFVQLL